MTALEPAPLDVSSLPAQVDPGGQLSAVLGPPSAADWNAMQECVAQISRSALIPASLRGKPADILVILLTGRELQIGPMQALQKVYVINGRPTMSAELMGALVLRAGHELVIHDFNDGCRVEARRRGSDKTSEFQFTVADAKAAGLLNKDTWKQYQRAMLRARAISSACRAMFPDVLMGVSYVPEEMGANVDPMTGEVDIPDEEMIPMADIEKYRERIKALPDYLMNGLRETMKERGWVLVRLPERLRGPFEAELEGCESWIRDDTAVGRDDEPAEAVIVGGDESDPDDVVVDDLESQDSKTSS